MFSELGNFLCRLKTNFRKRTQNGRQGFCGDGKNTRGTGGDLLTGSLAEILLKKIFVFHLPALSLRQTLGLQGCERGGGTPELCSCSLPKGGMARSGDGMLWWSACSCRDILGFGAAEQGTSPR